MDLATITAIRAELESALAGKRFGKIFQLSRSELAIDFRSPDPRYLFISIEPSNPRIYLIKRKLRELEKASGNPTPFSLFLRKKLSAAVVSSVKQLDGERVLLLSFDGADELEQPIDLTLAVQLTGASANLFVLDSQSTILDAARQTRGPGQQVGEMYKPPARRNADATFPLESPVISAGKDISEQLDAEAQATSATKDIQSLVNSARSKLKREISKREKLIGKLKEDLIGHGDADKWKRFGDLLLANVATARRDGEKVWLTDYFDENAPEISIDVDVNESITEAAEKFFRRYTKARNALVEIENRQQIVAKELKGLARKSDELEAAIAAGDEDLLREIAGEGEKRSGKKAGRNRDQAPVGTRKFISSDGFELLVGKKAKDNDFLTFRIAKSLDTWMHAADYPGSHVVIRNPNRKEIPHRTLLEAAQLAAFYSQGKSQPKAAVHYTQKKFVNKPRGAAAGLVSLASFKTILVEPKIGEAKLMVSGE